MILLAILALSLFAITLWWLSRPLRTAPDASAAGERGDLESLRDRLIAQLNELDAERADRGIDATVGREEELRLSAELAVVLKRLEGLATATGGPGTEAPRPTLLWPALTALAVLLVSGAGLYIWQNAVNLNGFVLAARSGPAAANVPPMVFEMVAKLEKRLAEQPDDAAGWARLGRSYVVLQKSDKALAAYARAHELAPDNVEVLSDYAWLVFSAQPGSTVGLAHTLYTKLNRLDPENVDALWFLGLAAYQQGEPATALRIWERLARKLPPASQELVELRKAMQVARDEAAGKKRR